MFVIFALINIPFMNNQLRKTIEEILTDQVINDSIHGLLKKYKDDHKEEIRLTGNKSDLIDNLISAVILNIIPLSEVHNLIIESEEYGNQYIYAFQLDDTTRKSYYDSGASVIPDLISSALHGTFPKLISHPKELQFVDFRIPNRGKANSWLLKLYDEKTREEKRNEEVNDVAETRTVTYAQIHSRLIYIIEYLGNGQLEIRISKTAYDSNLSRQQSLQQLRIKTSNGVHLQRDWKKIDYYEVIKNMILKYEDHEGVYKLLVAELKDSQNGKANISTFGEDDSSLLAEPSRRVSVEAYIENGGRAEALSVIFYKDGSDKLLSKNLLVILGRDDQNQIIISSSVTPSEYNYVKRKIAEFR